MTLPDAAKLEAIAGRAARPRTLRRELLADVALLLEAYREVTARRAPLSMGRGDWLRHHLEQLYEDVRAAREAQSWSAVANLQKRVEVARAALDAHADLTPADSTEGMDEAELRVALAEAAREMPDQHLEIFVAEYTGRHRIPRLEALPGGRES